MGVLKLEGAYALTLPYSRYRSVPRFPQLGSSVVRVQGAGFPFPLQPPRCRGAGRAWGPWERPLQRPWAIPRDGVAGVARLRLAGRCLALNHTVSLQRLLPALEKAKIGTSLVLKTAK